MEANCYYQHHLHDLIRPLLVNQNIGVARFVKLSGVCGNLRTVSVYRTDNLAANCAPFCILR